MELSRMVSELQKSQLTKMEKQGELQARYSREFWDFPHLQKLKETLTNSKSWLFGIFIDRN